MQVRLATVPGTSLHDPRLRLEPLWCGICGSLLRILSSTCKNREIPYKVGSNVVRERRLRWAASALLIGWPGNAPDITDGKPFRKRIHRIRR